MNFRTVTDFLGFTTPEKYRAESAPIVQPQDTSPERKILLEWTSEIRTEKSGFDKRSTRTWAVLLIVICVLLLLMQEFALILVIGSIIFIYYALSKAPIETVKIIVSNHGVAYAQNFYYWKDFKHYFFTLIDGRNAVMVDTVERLPGRLVLLFDYDKKSDIREVFSKYLVELEKEPESFANRAVKSIASKINLDHKKTN